MTVAVLLISPFPTVRAGLRALLGERPDIEILGEVAEPREIDNTWARRPDVMLVDGTAGPGAVEAIEARSPDIAMVVLGADPPRSRSAWRPLPRAYLAHDANAEEIAVAVHAVALGLVVIEPALLPGLFQGQIPVNTGATIQEPLTSRELEVLQLLAAGLPNKTIAARLSISEHTAKFHVSSVLSKLGAASRTEAVTLAARQGLLLL